MAKDTGRVAGRGVRAKRNHRGGDRRLIAGQAQDCGSPITFRKISIEKQIAAREAIIDSPCRSLFTFRVLCAHLPMDTVESRSNNRPQLWPTRCRLSGHSTRAFGIASQRSKDKCGNTSTFSSGTKTSDIQVDSRAPSPPDLRFRLSPPLVVAERIPVMCNQ